MTPSIDEAPHGKPCRIQNFPQNYHPDIRATHPAALAAIEVAVRMSEGMPDMVPVARLVEDKPGSYTPHCIRPRRMGR